MRLFKNSLTFSVALLAISATVVAYAGVFSRTKLNPPEPGCYETVNGFTIDHTLNYGNIQDFCAVSVATPSYCEGAEYACCFVVTSRLCKNSKTRAVTQIRCGEFIPDEDLE